ncbi:MAG: biotin--[acetyl-CoA-carboxylase] ligase [Syntrophomonas sp.]
MRERILEELYKHRDDFISGSQLASQLGISRVAVWKHIDALKDEGLEIEGISGKGYHLINAYNLVLPDEFSKQINTRFAGKVVRYYPQIDSTNEMAKRIYKQEKPPQGTVVLARKQTGGKGRRGRQWQSPPGGLWFSIILNPELPLPQIAILSLVCAVAVCHALKAFSPSPPMIKWPNDIFINGKKVAGILLEVSGELDHTDYVIAGIGINVNIETRLLPEAIRDTTTSLLEENDHCLDHSRVLALVLSNLERYYLQFTEEGFQNILMEFKEECLHLGKAVKISRGNRDIEGVNIDIDESGNLIIDTGAGIEKITTGDVVLIEKQEDQGCI